jgi:hypothetical protein
MLYLFDEKYKYTDAARQLESEFRKEITPLFEKYLRLGYSSREIEGLINDCIFSCVMEKRLMERVKK